MSFAWGMCCCTCVLCQQTWWMPTCPGSWDSRRRWLRCVGRWLRLRSHWRRCCRGELGTGKEVTARALHRLWLAQGRQDRFVAGNCATMSRELAASTLFGHTRGAFTGAHDNRPGLFRSAEGGTLFLRRNRELPMDVQPMLLRVLEERRVTPVGREDQGIDCDVRIITATNRALPQRCWRELSGQTCTAVWMRCTSCCHRCAAVAKRSCPCYGTRWAGAASRGTWRSAAARSPGHTTSVA